MSDVKELKENELEKVSGGFGYTINSINIGDCFSYRAGAPGATFLICRKNYPEINDENELLDFDLYYDNINDNGYQRITQMSSNLLIAQGYGYDSYRSNKNYIPR